MNKQESPRIQADDVGWEVKLENQECQTEVNKNEKESEMKEKNKVDQRDGERESEQVKDRMEREKMKKRKEHLERESSVLVFAALSGCAHSEPHVQMEADKQHHFHMSTKTPEH